MQQQEEQGLLLRGPQLAEFSRLEAEANARTSKTKALLDPLGTTQKASMGACSGALFDAFLFSRSAV